MKTFVYMYDDFCLSKMDIDYSEDFLVWVEALRPNQQFFSHVGKFSWVEPVLGNEDEVFCLRTQHCTPGEI